MPFAYYQRLSPKEKEIYRKSDGIEEVVIPERESLFPIVRKIEDSLKREDPLGLERSCQGLAISLSRRFQVPSIRIKILEVRPSNYYGELYGIYYPSKKNLPATIKLWMRTAKKGKVVAFKTFLRTFIHEFCHHLDYELFGLSESFHTEGFYKRESHILRQLLP